MRPRWTTWSGSCPGGLRRPEVVSLPRETDPLPVVPRQSVEVLGPSASEAIECRQSGYARVELVVFAFEVRLLSQLAFDPTRHLRTGVAPVVLRLGAGEVAHLRVGFSH